MAALIRDLNQSFSRYLRAEGRSPRTVETHCGCVENYVRWLEKQQLPTTHDSLTRRLIVAWLADLADHWKPATAATRFRGMSRFVKWLVAEDELDANPMEGLQQPEIPDKPVPVLTDDDLAALIKACSGRDLYDRRDEAIIRMLLDTGLRVSELCGITVDTGEGDSRVPGTLDLDNGAAIITGKGGKVRAVYFGARTERALDRYLRVRRTHHLGHLPNLLLGQRGPLSKQGVWAAMEARAGKAGLLKANPHRFRHTWAHDFLLAGGQERDLKRLAGWSSDKMLERYGSSAADARAAAAARKLRRGDRV